MILCAALLSAGFVAQDPAATLREELAQLVDLPTATARQNAADALAKNNPATLEQWLEACRTFGDFGGVDPGPTRVMVGLQVLEQTEKTELHLFVPKGYDPKKPTPLLLWGHGAGGTGAREYLLWEQLADRIGLLVLAPTEFGKVQGWGCTERERQAQLAALRWARRQVNVDENAIFLGGWSRGGHMTWDVMLRHPDLFAGALPCIGGPRMQLGAQNNLRYLENVAHLPIRDLQGAGDDPLLLMNLHLAFERLAKLGAKDAVLKEFPDRGHDADLAAVDWAEFFQRRRDGKPQRLVRLAAEATEIRARWATITAFEERVVADHAPQVNPETFDRLDEAKKRAVLLDRLAERTARLVAQDKGQGRFVVDSKGVASFALLLDGAMLGKDGAVEVRWQSKPVRKKVTPDAAVLLREFAERFDRTFLPVARVVVP